jgi:hypothetical protein
VGMVPQADKGKQELTSVLRFLIVLALSVAAWAAPLTVVCSVDVPVVEPHDAAVASVLAQTPVPAALHYRWSASGGLLHETEKSSAEWNPNSSAERPYTISVTVTDANGSSGTCSVIVLVGRATRSGSGFIARFPRVTRSMMLLPGKTEGEKFGLYSYLLLGSKPNSENRERYKNFLQAFTDKVAAYDRLKDELIRAQLNVTYLPMLKEPSANLGAEGIVDDYDYDRARRFLESFKTPPVGDGPFIVSCEQPLQGAGHDEPTRYLLEDLSTVPATVLKFWVTEFLAQTAQERWDNKASLRRVALRIRTELEIAAVAYPQIESSLSGLLLLK